MITDSTTHHWTASYWDGRTARSAASTLTVPTSTSETEVRGQALAALRRHCQVDMVFTFAVTSATT